MLAPPVTARAPSGAGARFHQGAGPNPCSDMAASLTHRLSPKRVKYLLRLLLCPLIVTIEQEKREC